MHVLYVVHLILMRCSKNSSSTYSSFLVWFFCTDTVRCTSAPASECWYLATSFQTSIKVRCKFQERQLCHLHILKGKLGQVIERECLMSKLFVYFEWFSSCQAANALPIKAPKTCIASLRRHASERYRTSSEHTCNTEHLAYISFSGSVTYAGLWVSSK